jgi:hypothetical protein
MASYHTDPFELDAVSDDCTIRESKYFNVLAKMASDLTDPFDLQAVPNDCKIHESKYFNMLGYYLKNEFIPNAQCVPPVFRN